jgi:RNA polymerase sigma-70 factor, ECF subfamily
MGNTAAGTQEWAQERELVEALRRGDSEAFEALVNQYQELMMRVASMYVRSPAVAQEVVQDTWLSVLKGIRSFEGRSSLKTWIFRILANSAKTRGSREQRTVPFSALGAADETRDPDPVQIADDALRPCGAEGRAAHPEQRVLSREVVAEAIRAIHRLPDGQRQVIAMRDLHGCSSDEVCSQLGISSGNQRVQLHRARAKVERELRGYLAAAAPQPV